MHPELKARRTIATLSAFAAMTGVPAVADGVANHFQTQSQISTLDGEIAGVRRAITDTSDPAQQIELRAKEIALYDRELAVYDNSIKHSNRDAALLGLSAVAALLALIRRIWVPKKYRRRR